MSDSMTIPAGLTCGDCRMFPKCSAIIGVRPDSTECDFFPVKFVASHVQITGYKREIEQLRTRAERAEADAARLRKALQRVRISYHYECDDNYYSCPQAADYADGDRGLTKCNCGKDENNKIIDAALEGGQQ